MEKYKIKRVLNNNAILAKVGDDSEVILIGKGIGFAMRSNSDREIPLTDDVEKVFVPLDASRRREFLDTFINIDEDIIDVCNEIIEFAEDHIGKLNKRIHLILTDHVSYAIDRIQMGISIETPLLFDVRIIYPEEFTIARQALNIIEKRLGMRLPEDESAFIAIHLNAARHSKDVKETLKYTSIISEMIDELSHITGRDIKNDDIYKFIFQFLTRWIDQIDHEVELPNPLLGAIYSSLNYYYDIAMKLSSILEKKKDCTVTKGDVGFLAFYLYFSLEKK